MKFSFETRRIGLAYKLEVILNIWQHQYNMAYYEVHILQF